MAGVRHAENKPNLNNHAYKDLEAALAEEKLLRDQEIGKGQPFDQGRGNGAPALRVKKLLLGNTRNTLSREQRLHNYSNSTDDPKKILSSFRDVLVPDSKNMVEPLNEYDRKRENKLEMTTHQITLHETAKNNFRKRSNLLTDFTYVGY